MRNSWRHFYRRLAALGVISGGIAWSSAMCYAVQLAFDSADDSAYADGWQEGDNGGSGFTPWNFESNIFWQGSWYDYAAPGVKSIDDGLKAGIQFSNPFNDIGKAWTLATTPESDGVNRVGRGFPALQPDQTFSVTVDNPDQRHFGNGYFIRLNGGTGGMNGNICYGGTACLPGLPTPAPKLNVRIYEYFSNGQWGIADGAGFANIPLFDHETADGGMRLDITLTDADSYDLVMTPLANPPMVYNQSGTFANPGVPIDWLEFTFFNTNKDTAAPPAAATDFYIRRIEIMDPALPGVPGDYDGNRVVDAADLDVWTSEFGQASTGLDADGDVDGDVDGSDFLVWQRQLGSAAIVTWGESVPEPGAIPLILVASCGLTLVHARRWKTRQKTLD